MKCNYLILPKENSSYQVQMFTKNTIFGFLSGKVRMENGESRIYYDISSRQPLVRVYERKEMVFEDLKKLFYSWEKAVTEAERYLLNPSFLLCSPEYIYFDYSQGRPEWLFYPQEEEREYPLGLTELAEFLLEKVNHKDVIAVDIAYLFYRSAKENRVFLPEIIKALDDSVVKPEEKIPQDSEETRISLSEEVVPVFSEDDEEETDNGGDILDFLNRMFRSVKRRKKPDKKKKEKEESKPSKQMPLAEKRGKTGETFILWEEEDAEENEYKKTRLINTEGGVKRELTDILTKEKYPLKNLPVVVGKLEGSVDICLKDDSVSRLHARFFEQDGDIFLEDLNSTNGCSVNEIPLENNEKVKLSPGDRILIGETEFIYN